MTAAARTLVATPIRSIRPFIVLARQHGWNPAGVAERLGLRVDALDEPETQLPPQLAADLLNSAIAASENREIGLLAARWVDRTRFGAGELVAHGRPTLMAALEGLSRYLPLLGDGAGYAIERAGADVITRFWFSPELAIREEACEFALAVSVLCVRRITGIASFAPREVHFTHARPASTAAHEALFGCPVYFDADVAHSVLSSESLEILVPIADAAHNDGEGRPISEFVPRGARRDDVTSRVQELLGGGEIDLRGASAERVARRLGMSVRTLSRRLDAEATSYRELVDEVRKSAALRELTHDGRPIAEIADRLGFASSQSFHRAFKRWTGTTADRTRRSARALRD